MKPCLAEVLETGRENYIVGNKCNVSRKLPQNIIMALPRSCLIPRRDVATVMVLLKIVSSSGTDPFDDEGPEPDDLCVLDRGVRVQASVPGALLRSTRFKHQPWQAFA